MFFSISTQKEDDRFLEHYQFEQFKVSVDEGWNVASKDNKTFIYKGYCDQFEMTDIVNHFAASQMPISSGNFCVIVINHQLGTVNIGHPQWRRKFPLWLLRETDNVMLTNLCKVKFVLPRLHGGPNTYERMPKTENFPLFENNGPVKTHIKNFGDTEYIPSELICEFNGSDIQTLKWYKNTTVESTNTIDRAIEYITSSLGSKSWGFWNNPYKKKAFLSGGLDTMSTYSVVSEQLPPEDVVFTEQKTQNDKFYWKNFNYLHYNWDYYRSNYLITFDEPTMVTTGVGGDENFMRHLFSAGTWFAWHDIDFGKLAQQSSSMHYRQGYLARADRLKMFTSLYEQRAIIKEHCPTYQDLTNYLINIKHNDFASWHLGNTLMWSPLDDPRYLMETLSLDFDSLKDQIMHEKIERGIINTFNENLLNYISSVKNTNAHENFVDWSVYQDNFLKPYEQEIKQAVDNTQIAKVQNKYQKIPKHLRLEKQV